MWVFNIAIAALSGNAINQILKLGKPQWNSYMESLCLLYLAFQPTLEQHCHALEPHYKLMKVSRQFHPLVLCSIMMQSKLQLPICLGVLNVYILQKC